MKKETLNISNKENLFSNEPEKDNQNLFSNNIFYEQADKEKSELEEGESKNVWKVLVVDDEEDVHSVTRMALKGFTYLDKEIQFLHAFSAAETRELLTQNSDIALVLLDVVMESNDAGLELVDYIRNELNNKLTQIVLRTGYPGQAPERSAITDYEINDYRTKTELTTFKLFTVTMAGLRSYNSLIHLEDLRQNLEEKVKERTVELEEKNVQILEMDEMKTRFFANISHEFRSPLTLIIGSIEEMLLKGDFEAKHRDYLEMIYRNANRILDLANQLLDLSKIDAGKLKIELVNYDVLKLLGRIAKSFVPFAERKKIDYNINISNKKTDTYFDADKLEKIVTNLLNNAFKFTPDKGRIELAVTIQEDNKLEIAISDTGIGIPKELADKVFSRFYQLDNTNKGALQGTGIGLSLVKELIDLQYGTLQLESDLNKGSKFTVQIPLGKNHLKEGDFAIIPVDEKIENPLLLKCYLSENNDQQEITDDTIDDNKPLVLVVEDNFDIQQHICNHFNDKFNVKKADDGEQGWEKVQSMVPDLVISDVMMPGISGKQLCENIKTTIATNHIPVILLTAKATSEDRIVGLETGADDYITKPFNMDELIVRADNLIEQRKKLQEKYRSQTVMQTSKLTVSSHDERFLKQAMKVIEQNISDCEFDVNSFFVEMNMSRMQLFRKFKALLNQTPGELIRNMRLNKAAQLLKQNFGNIAEVAFESGFNNLSYFSKCFKEKFGMLPSEFCS